MIKSMNESLNDEDVYRTAPATPGLLMFAVGEGRIAAEGGHPIG